MAGSGGQGLVLAGIMLGEAAMLEGKVVMQSQTYEAASRGGFSMAEVIMSTEEIIYQHVQEIFVIRVALEQLAARLALEKATSDQIKTFRMLVEKINEASGEKNIVAMIEADSNFHDHLFQLSGNLTLHRMINDLRNRSQIIRYAAWSSPDVLNRIFEEHGLIVDAIESRDVARLNSLVERHIGHAKEVYLFRLKAETALLT